MSSIERIKELLIRRLEEGKETDGQQELQDWMNESEDNRKTAEAFLNDDLLLEGIKNHYQSKERIWERVKEVLPNNKRPVPTLHKWRRLFVAAAMLVVLAGGAWFFVQKKQEKPLIKNNSLPEDVKPPTSSMAILTLADGTIVPLDSAQSGTLATQDQMKVRKTAEGEIIYEGNAGTSVQYNMLTNPRGSKVISLVLSEGTKVWLNNESSIRYPTSFTGKERKVEITGEVYFEVTSDKVLPFIVSKGNTQIQVIGTHFNVNAYDDEALMKITLLEGSVRVSQESGVRSKESVVIKPGEQAVVTHNSPLTIHHSPDLEQVMAWKNGLFDFQKADIGSIMRQIERWYNVEVVYEEKPSGTFSGEVSRNTNVSSVLKILEYSGVHSRIEGSKIIITK